MIAYKFPWAQHRMIAYKFPWAQELTEGFTDINVWIISFKTKNRTKRQTEIWKPTHPTAGT